MLKKIIDFSRFIFTKLKRKKPQMTTLYNWLRMWKIRKIDTYYLVEQESDMRVNPDEFIFKNIEELEVFLTDRYKFFVEDAEKAFNEFKEDIKNGKKY